MSVNIVYFVVFVLMSMAIFLCLDFGKDMQASAIASKTKKRKQQSFKAQSKLKRKLLAAVDQQKAIVTSSPIPGPIFIILTGVCCVGGFAAGKVVFHSTFLSVIVAVLSTLIPLIVVSFKEQKAKSKYLNRLCSSMMVLSNSYLVTEDFLTSVKENLAILEYPEPFRDFLAYATMMDSDISSALRRLENQVNNPYFSQWIDALVLAQDDRSLRYVAVSVVDSMHDVLAAQEESDAVMYAVWREYLLTIVLIFSVPLVFKVLMAEAYVTMTTSFAGQSLMVLLLIAIVYSVFKALKINKPLMM